MMTMSAASTAMCVPPAPMAKPISACARAGASLMPSPTMPVAPWRWWLVMASSLCSGSSSPCTCVMPSCAATAVAVAEWSPLSMAVVMPKACKSASASWVWSFTVSATANTATASCPIASRVTVWPRACWALIWALSASVAMPCSCSQRSCPSSSVVPSASCACMPRPGTAVMACRLLSGRGAMSCCWRPCAMASDTGWSDWAANTSAVGRACACWFCWFSCFCSSTSTSWGLPMVSVPVLSKAMVLSARACSR